MTEKERFAEMALFHCPKCGRIFELQMETTGNPFCPRCKAKLKWGEAVKVDVKLVPQELLKAVDS